jgi:hypothetical protein
MAFHLLKVNAIKLNRGKFGRVSLRRQPDSPFSPPFASTADGVRQFLRYGGPQAEVEDDVEQMGV